MAVNKLETPALDKLRANATAHMAIIDFLEWAEKELKAELAVYGPGSSRMEPLNMKREALASRFLDIDHKQVEAERQAILASISP